MASREHQEKINGLVKVLEEKEKIEITHIDIDGTPEYFDLKYRSLPIPKQRNGHIPDLVGTRNGVNHLGEVKTEVLNDNNIDGQLKAFTSRQMKDGRAVPLHLAVPRSQEAAIMQKIRNLELESEYNKGNIKLWFFNGS